MGIEMVFNKNKLTFHLLTWLKCMAWEIAINQKIAENRIDTRTFQYYTDVSYTPDRPLNMEVCKTTAIHRLITTEVLSGDTGLTKRGVINK